MPRDAQHKGDKGGGLSPTLLLAMYTGAGETGQHTSVKWLVENCYEEVERKREGKR